MLTIRRMSRLSTESSVRRRLMASAITGFLCSSANVVEPILLVEDGQLLVHHASVPSRARQSSACSLIVSIVVIILRRVSWTEDSIIDATHDLHHRLTRNANVSRSSHWRSRCSVTSNRGRACFPRLHRALIINHAKTHASERFSSRNTDSPVMLARSCRWVRWLHAEPVSFQRFHSKGTIAKVYLPKQQLRIDREQ